MSVEVEGAVLRLSGRCSAAEAEAVLAALAAGASQVDLSGCEHMHAAVLQLLMAAQVEVAGRSDGFIGQWLLPVLRGPAADAREMGPT